jgi:hypothetical protein
MADVKLLASQRLTDNPDGGGLMTSTEIVDGVVNNLWPDVSRVDRAYGVVNLRKLYLQGRHAGHGDLFRACTCICLTAAAGSARRGDALQRPTAGRTCAADAQERGGALPG